VPGVVIGIFRIGPVQQKLAWSKITHTGYRKTQKGCKNRYRMRLVNS